MVKQLRLYSAFLLPVAYLLLAVLVWLTVMCEFRLDDSFITYRYAQNFAGGAGLVYNPGDSVLSTTAPLYAMLLAALSFVIPDFHLLGSFIGIMCIGLGGWVIYKLLPTVMPEWIRLWAGLVYTLSSPLWLALGMETALWILLVLAAIALGQRGWWAWAGLLVGLAVLARPDAALPSGLLGLAAIGTTVNTSQTRERWWLPLVGYVGAGIVPIVLFALWAVATYGSPFPATLSAKSAQAVLGITGLGVNVDTWEGLRLILRSLMTQSSLYVALALLAVLGLAGSISISVFLVVIWGALHLLAYVVLRVAPYRWYYAPLVPGLVLLAACGLYFIYGRLQARKFRFAAYLAAALAIFPLIAQLESFVAVRQQILNGGPVDVMLPIVDWQAYRETGEWLDNNAPPDATVGVAEVGQVGFYARRWMTDYLGLLQPDASQMLKRGDLYSWLAGYAPDYLVFQRFRGAPLVLYNYVIEEDSWFKANYQPVTEFDDPRYSSGPVTIFERATPENALNPQAIQLDFGNLRLIGLATDGDSLTGAGGAVRVRLDWEVLGELPPEIHIAVKGLDMAGTNPAFDGDYGTAHWQGAFSTWHGFVVPEGAEPGQYTLLVAVGPKGGPYQEQGAGLLVVSS
ncbi:MAG: glycosyltransferase family 39 protein [Anaerolineae bacterium]|nr:glycosyltransferase family 39 protein [Anaerolineae bacterium]